MTVIIPNEAGRSATVERPASMLPSTSMDGWRFIWWLGLAFAILSLVDITLGWYPLDMGSAQWEFGALSGTMSAFWMPTLGTYLMLAAAVSRGERRKAIIVAGVMAAMALLLLAFAMLYVTNVPIGLKTVAHNYTMAVSFKKAIAKWVALFIGFEILLIAGAVKTFRRSRPR